MGLRGVLVCCHSGHNVALSAARWSDDVRLSDIEARCVCAGCGNRGAQVRPDFSTGKPPQFARSSARWRNERAEEKLQVLLALFFELAERPRHQPSSPQAGVVSQCASFRCQHIPDSFRPPPFHLPNGIDDR
jgi:hypothetical protein